MVNVDRMKNSTQDLVYLGEFCRTYSPELKKRWKKKISSIITLKTDGLKRYNWNIAVTKVITNSYYTT